MKISQNDIAQALVDVSMELPEDKFSAEIDSAIAMLKRSNPGKPLRSFPYVLERMLYRRGKMFTAKLFTPTGKAGEQAAIIEEMLVEILKRPVELEEIASPDMIGGAILLVGDERFDMSIKGALEQLKDYLTTTSHLFDIPHTSHES